MTTNEIGRITEAKVLARLVELGKYVLIPFSNIGRYDLLVDEQNGKYTRIECKTGRISNGCVLFNTCSNGGYNQHLKKSKDYKNDADFFGVYCGDLNKVYLIPIGITPKSSMMLRVENPAGPCNKSNINWAKDFEL